MIFFCKNWYIFANNNNNQIIEEKKVYKTVEVWSGVKKEQMEELKKRADETKKTLELDNQARVLQGRQRE